MSYAVVISPLAKQQIAAQPQPMRTFIAASLQQLARSPSSFTRRAPASGRGQTAEFRFEGGGSVVWVTVSFLYGQDEQTLHVERVSVEFGA